MAKKQKKVEYLEIGGNTYTVLYAYRKSGERMLARTNQGGGGIRDVYKRPSETKVWAWRQCMRICTAMNGRRLRITGHNCMEFTAAFEAEYEEQPVRIVFTHLHNYIIFK